MADNSTSDPVPNTDAANTSAGSALGAEPVPQAGVSLDGPKAASVLVDATSEPAPELMPNFGPAPVAKMTTNAPDVAEDTVDEQATEFAPTTEDTAKADLPPNAPDMVKEITDEQILDSVPRAESSPNHELSPSGPEITKDTTDRQASDSVIHTEIAPITNIPPDASNSAVVITDESKKDDGDEEMISTQPETATDTPPAFQNNPVDKVIPDADPMEVDADGPEQSGIGFHGSPGQAGDDVFMGQSSISVSQDGDAYGDHLDFSLVNDSGFIGPQLTPHGGSAVFHGAPTLRMTNLAAANFLTANFEEGGFPLQGSDEPVDASLFPEYQPLGDAALALLPENSEQTFEEFLNDDTHHEVQNMVEGEPSDLVKTFDYDSNYEPDAGAHNDPENSASMIAVAAPGNSLDTAMDDAPSTLGAGESTGQQHAEEEAPATPISSEQSEQRGNTDSEEKDEESLFIPEHRDETMAEVDDLPKKAQQEAPNVAGINLGKSMLGPAKLTHGGEASKEKRPAKPLSMKEMIRLAAEKNKGATRTTASALHPPAHGQSNATERLESSVQSAKAAKAAEDREYAKAEKRFNTLKSRFEIKKAAQTVTGEEEIAYLREANNFADLTRRHESRSADAQVDAMRLERAIDTPMEEHGQDVVTSRKRTFNQVISADEDLVFDEDDDDCLPFEEDDDHWANHLSRPKKAKKAAKEAPKETAGPVLANKTKRKYTKRTTTGANTKTKRGAKAKEDGSSKTQPPGKAAGEKKAKGKKKQTGPEMVNISSLFTANLMQDAKGNNLLAPQPVFSSTKKDEALKELIASLPEEEKKTATVDKQYLLRATKDFGRGACRSDGKGGWLVRGMKTSLTHYQVLGGSFMRNRETGSDKPRGGILADQMGLGKTLQSLAIIVSGRPKGDGPRTTLIVAPPALCSQWYSEILKHCHQKYIGSILKYYGGDRLATNASHGPEAFSGFDVVIATYSEILRSYPKGEAPMECQTAEDRLAWWNRFYAERKGVFHRVNFHRIILDEAQVIKNHQARTSLACRAMKAEHRWALSGTPIMNTVKELYPYFRFLRIPHTGSFRVFRHNFYGENDPVKVRRLHALLTKFMIRRTHADKLFGRPLLQLPDSNEQIQYLKFNDFERNIYDIVRTRMIRKINDFAKNGELNKKYANIFVMMLRLRQLTCHILLLENVMRDVLELEDIEKLQELASAECDPKVQNEKTQQIIQLRKALASKAATDCTRKNCSPDADDEGGADENGGEDLDFDQTGGNHGLEYDFQKYLTALQKKQNWDEIQERTTCALCGQPAYEPFLAECYHIHCRQCIESLQELAASRDWDGGRCALCNIPFHGLRQVVTDYINYASSSSESSKSKPNSKDTSRAGSRANSSPPSQAKGKKGRGIGKGKGKGKAKRNVDEEDEEAEAIHGWIELEDSVLPSPKTIAIKAQLLNWFSENAETKVIIYTQFIPMIQILAKVCEGEGWPFEKYFGSMSFKAREEAIKNFGDDSKCRILLASLRCGGLGLNLTMASKVICIDPWWNNSVDQQAFGRVFRMGQESKTHFLRLVVQNSIDDNMMRMQDKKQKEINQVLGRQQGRMNIKELISLFCDGENNREFVIPDKVLDDDSAPMPLVDSDDEQLLDST